MILISSVGPPLEQFAAVALSLSGDRRLIAQGSDEVVAP